MGGVFRSIRLGEVSSPYSDDEFGMDVSHSRRDDQDSLALHILSFGSWATSHSAPTTIAAFKYYLFFRTVTITIYRSVLARNPH